MQGDVNGNGSNKREIIARLILSETKASSASHW